MNSQFRKSQPCKVDALELASNRENNHNEKESLNLARKCKLRKKLKKIVEKKRKRANISLFNAVGFFNHELPKSEATATAPTNREQRRGNRKIEEACAGKAQWCAKEEERQTILQKEKRK